MVETDWRQLLGFSQKELNSGDKETLCEGLSWMETEDGDLGLADLKTLFRLAQDILKYKSEQVNNLLGQLESTQRRNGKKSRVPAEDSPSGSPESALETIARQEETIRSNKQTILQLQAELQACRSDGDRDQQEKDSDSSRGALSEANAIEELERDLAMRNRHIRKLLTDVRVLEEENVQLKEKTSVLNDKLTEATLLIENLTEQLYTLNTEGAKLRGLLGNAEELRAQLTIEVESLQKELFEKDADKDSIYDDIRSKIQHWKNLARSKKAENEALSDENRRLKENINQVTVPSTSPKMDHLQEEQIKELQEKLAEATTEIVKSASLIEALKSENKQLKETLKETEAHGSVSDLRNESDDGKERALISKLKRRVNDLTIALHGTEEMLTVREQELAEITSQLQLLQSGEEGLSTILESLKSKKRQLKLKDEGIKSLVQEVNNLNQSVDELQLENKAMRSKLNISPNAKVSTKGILKKYQSMEQFSMQMTKEVKVMENKLISTEIENRDKKEKIDKLVKFLHAEGYTSDKIEEIYGTNINEHNGMPTDGGGESSAAILQIKAKEKDEKIRQKEEEMQAVVEENEGLRKGLQEILDFLKDNSTSSSGILALQCPSLEAVLQSLEARHSAGWFAPHMATVLELRAALGGRDALLNALHEARKETFDVVAQLSKESKKSQELEQKLNEMESMNKTHDNKDREQNDFTFENTEFGTWMTKKEHSLIDFNNRSEIEDIQRERNANYENQLRNSITYFHNKFKELFDKMTAISIQSVDEQNKWSLQEEKYKAEIEHLKSCLSQRDDDDRSEDSPGLISSPSITVLQRKCVYLEESYKYIRTLNENIKNEFLETKKEVMILTAEYETKIQKLILSIADITDKLRNSISLDMFWKQSDALNELTFKYNKTVYEEVKKHIIASDMQNLLQKEKMDIIETIQRTFIQNTNIKGNGLQKLLANVEHSVLQKQIERLCAELETITKRLENAEKKNLDLQETQSIIIDKNISTATQDEINVMKEQLEKMVAENKILRDQCQHVGGQLEIALSQLQDTQQRQLSNDMEINMLRHQILDLQSAGDNKAIIARLSGEILVAHLQASESHKKMERLNAAVNNEIQRRVEAEEMLKARENIFNIYSQRYESKFRYLYEILQILRQQYHGSVPLTSVENYLNNVEDFNRKSHDLDEKLNEIEELRSNLMIKHAVFDQTLNKAKEKCLDNEEKCPHELKLCVMQNMMSREKEYYSKKIQTLEKSRDELVQYCNNTERTLVLLNQVFNKSPADYTILGKDIDAEIDPNLELEDVQSDEDSRRSGTITLPKPHLLITPKNGINMPKFKKDDDTYSLPGSPIKLQNKLHKIIKTVNVSVQTITEEVMQNSKTIQTDVDKESQDLKKRVINLQQGLDYTNENLSKALFKVRQKTEENLSLTTDKINSENITQNLKETLIQKESLIENLQSNLVNLNKELQENKSIILNERKRFESTASEENKSLLQSLRDLEREKNIIVDEYKQMLTNERDEYLKSGRDLNKKIVELKLQLDRKDSDASNTDAVKEVASKYSVKTIELEDKCFKLQSELDSCSSVITRYQSEAERWKELATERLSKMEQLNSQLKERHCHEMESYKAESQHWLTQLHETQREHQELRNRLSEQKAMHVKQLTEKDALIDQLRTIVHSLKGQIMNMQTMMSIHDPTFDLSAIVEVEDSEGGSDRLEIRFDSSSELRDDVPLGIPSTSTAIWQEPIIDRLRREKHLTSKQNSILRRQIKALAARERRARLEAHNLKNQVYRISTSGSKMATAESVSLQAKIASLQAQLSTAHRDTQSNVALWDKWKRAQQSSERWQAKYEEKCREVNKLASSLNLAKTAVTRLEKEKRSLLSKLHDIKNDKPPWYEKQDHELTEKARTPRNERPPELPSHVSTQALMDRIQAQQRRIAALELAEKGNEPLVSEYERALAELTTLRGQVLHLESSMLENQLRSPLHRAPDPQPELNYWKSYCDMLKDENMQLSIKLSSMETVPSSAHHQRVADLEQTILTLRGLVSKLQAEQKTSGSLKRTESRPSSGRGGTDKGRNQLESYRTEIANLKRSIADKDNLLERSKEMLKIAAEREDELLRENAYLHHQIEELTRHRGGFLSA